MRIRFVGVHPARELSRRARLFGALSRAVGVRFEPTDDPSVPRGTAIIAFGVDPGALAEGPGDCFIFADAADTPPREGTVELGSSPRLDSRLRGWALRDRFAGERSLPVPAGTDVLATVDGRPVWAVHEEAERVVHEVAVTPSELAPDEPLRDRLDPGRFVELLPLVHWLRELAGELGWKPPPLRAAFIVDDPNLHWRSYGHLDFRELVSHARAHGYHASLATIPLDAWYANRTTVRLFHEGRDVVSLSIHGNNHLRRELGAPSDVQTARRSLIEARLRIASFERRTGLDVSPVLIPPYEASSPTSLDAILDVGLDAAALTRPCSWLPVGPQHSPYRVPEGDDPLSGWRIAELTKRGLPIMIRRGYDEHDEVVLRAFLGQPILLFGHVSDFAEGLARLERAANVVNSLPRVAWSPLGDIAAGNFEWRRSGQTLHVRPFARRIRIEVDPAITEVRLEPPPDADGFGHGVRVALDGEVVELRGRDALVQLPRGRERDLAVEARWHPPVAIVPHPAWRPTLSPLPLARRTATEARDRLAPFLRAGSRRTSSP